MSLRLDRVSKRFGGFLALDAVSLEVPSGALVGLIGTNGAGKSTVFGVVSGLLAGDGGSVEFDGRPILGLAAHRRAQLGMGRTFQVPREFAHLTVTENLLAAAPHAAGETLGGVFFAPARVRATQRGLVAKAHATLDFLRLDRVREQPAGELSGGQKKLLELGRVLMREPRLILLDEPFAGVNPVLVKELAERIRELNARGVGFLVIEHNLEALSSLVDRIYVMDRGRIIAEGAPREVLADDRVLEAYMGGVV